MDDKVIHRFQYSGETIFLLQDGRFHVGEAEEDEGGRIYESLVLAQAAIDRQLRARARTKREKLNIPVYVKIKHYRRWASSTPESEEFVERKLVGVHGGLGTLLLDPPVDKDDISTVYVRNERVKDILVEEVKLERQLEVLRQELTSLTLSSEYSSGRIDDTRHAQIVRDIKEKCGVGQ